jgi:sarcosine oxidase / L-pipecolate oxidase
VLCISDSWTVPTLLERFDLLHHLGSSHGASRTIRELGGGVLNTTKAVAMFQALAVKKGAMIRDNTEVVDIRKGEKGGVVVRTSAGEEFRGAKCMDERAGQVRRRRGHPHPAAARHSPVLARQSRPRARAHGGGRWLPDVLHGDQHVYGTLSLELPAGLIKVNYDGGSPCDPDGRDWANGSGDVARWI